MSAHVESYVRRLKAGNPTRKLILLTLASWANNDGWVTASQNDLADECEVLRGTVNEHLRELRAAGRLEVVEGKRGRPLRYRILGPWCGEGVGESDSPSAEASDGRPAPVGSADTPGPRVSADRTPPVGNTDSPSPQTPLPPVSQEPKTPTPPTPPRPATVDGAKVTSRERDLAEAILAAFNRRFETRYVASDHFVGVVMRLRERPDLTLEEAERLIDKLARQSWWRKSKRGERVDKPTPRHIFGSGKAFDFAVNSPEPGRVLIGGEFADYAGGTHSPDSLLGEFAPTDLEPEDDGP